MTDRGNGSGSGSGSGNGSKRMDKGKSILVEEEEESFRPTRRMADVESSSNNEEEEEAMFWTTDLSRHFYGTVSTAVMQPSADIEEFSQVELGRTSTYVGIYDGHGGYQAAAYVSRNMTRELMGRIRDTSTMSVKLLREAFAITETAWLEMVDERFLEDPYLAGSGTCCLVGVFWKRNLYVANVGDSRAIIGRAHEDPAKINVHRITTDDNVNDDTVRAEVLALHPEEPDFVENTAGHYRIKGRIQVSKSIGDAYLKRAKFNLNHVHNRFKLNAPVRDDNPALSADPRTNTIPIEPQDRFVIFASDGLWDMLTNQEAADIVHQNPKEGIAERLVIAGLTKVSTRTTYTEKELRRRILSNVTVIVIYLDHSLLGAPELIRQQFTRHSIRQGSVSSKTSCFKALDDMAAPQNRTVVLRNLPFGTTANDLYTRLWRWAPVVQAIVVGVDGFTATVLFFNSRDARAFVKSLRDRIILKGKLCCMSFIYERQYLRRFFLVDYLCAKMELPYTVHVSNLTEHVITVESISSFFNSFGLVLRNIPIMHRSRANGRLYAFVTFSTIPDRETALLFDGFLLLNHFIRISPRQPPYLEINPNDF